MLGFLVSMSWWEPHCFCSISILIQLWPLVIRILMIILVLHGSLSCLPDGLLNSFAPDFGITTKIDLLRSSGISPLLYILFIISVILLILNCLKFDNILITIPSSLVAWFLLIFASAYLTSDFNTASPFMFLFCRFHSLFIHRRAYQCIHPIFFLL